MSFPRYPSNEIRGVDSRGEVPAHWEAKRLRFVAELNPSKSEVARLDRKTVISFLPMEAIGEDGTFRLDEVKPIGEVENGYTYFRDGDVVIAKITPCFENGKGALMQGLVNGVGFGTTELIVARPKPGEIDGSYLNYLFMSPDFRLAGESYMYGAGGQKRVPDSFVRNFRAAIPPIAEQERIAAFLNLKTAMIDELVAEQRRLMALLTEKRQAIISEVITKGLNPRASLKPSGVTWLGDVPAHWEVVRVGSAFREVVEMGSEELPILSVSIHHGVSNEEIDEAGMDRKVTRSDDRSKYKRVSPSDLVYNMMRAWQGAFGTVTVTGMVSPAYVVARPSRPLETRYVEHLLRTPRAVEEMRRYSHGVTDFRLRLYWSEFKNLRIALPPSEEAIAINAKIAEMVERFDRMSAACESAIAILLERRSALISAAVMGRIDIRSLATS